MLGSWGLDYRPSGRRGRGATVTPALEKRDQTLLSGRKVEKVRCRPSLGVRRIRGLEDF